MEDTRRFGFLDFLLLLLVIGAAGGARAGYLMTCAKGGKNDGPLRVQELSAPTPGGAKDTEQASLIENVRTDTWFASRAPLSDHEETTAHVAPGYSYLVGLLAKSIPDEAELFRTVRWGQVGLGAIAAGIYFLFARRAFRSSLVGLLAGLFVALHPFWIIETANISDATLASTALGLTLLLGSAAGEKGGAFTSLLLGASLAGLALVRAAFLPFSFIMLVWFLLRSRELRLGWLCALCAFLGFGAAISPWSIRNYQVFQKPLPVVSSTYLHLWIGNNPKATGGSATDEMWATLSNSVSTESQPERYEKLGRLVLDEVRERPTETIHRRIWAGLYFVFGQHWFKEGQLAVVETTLSPPLPMKPAVENKPEEGEKVEERLPPPAPAEPVAAKEDGHEQEKVLAWLLTNYNLVLQAVLLGMLLLTYLGWRWSYAWRYQCVPAALAMIWVPLPFLLGHAGMLSGERLPLDGAMLSFSAFALCCLLPGLSGHLLSGPAPKPAASEAETSGQEQYQYQF